MDYELLFPSRYLKAVDLQNRDVTVTIAGVTLEQLPLRGTSQTRQRGVIALRKTEKQLVLNRTNAEVIVEIYGRDTDDWIDKQITLYPTRVKFGHQMVDAIRVRPHAPRSRDSRPSAPEEAA